MPLLGALYNCVYMMLLYITGELVIWISSLKQTVQKNQFLEKNHISPSVWGSGLQVML